MELKTKLVSKRRMYIKRAKEDNSLKSFYHIIAPQKINGEITPWLMFHPYSMSLYVIESGEEAKILKLLERYSIKETARILEISQSKVEEIAEEYTSFLKNKEPDNFAVPIMPTSFWMIVSNICQMKCRYCYVNSGSAYPTEHTLFMNKETAILSVEKILEMAPTIATINFFGGEPTLNMETVVAVTDFIKRNYPEISMYICTNGCTITEDIAKFFARNDIGVTVSIDGYKEANNINRKYLGKDSFSRIIKSIETLRKYDINLYIEATYSPDNFILGQAPIDIVTFLANLTSKKVVIFKFMEIFETLKDIQANDFKTTYDLSLVPKFYEYLDYIFESLTSDDPIYDSSIAFAVGLLLRKQTSLFPCPFSNFITILVNGDVYGCHLLMSREGYFGNIRENNLEDKIESKLEYMLERMFISNIDYKSFWYYPLQDICPAYYGGLEKLSQHHQNILKENLWGDASFVWERVLINYYYIANDKEKEKRLIENIIKEFGKE